jgi:hypothetical protein
VKVGLRQRKHVKAEAGVVFLFLSVVVSFSNTKAGEVTKFNTQSRCTQEQQVREVGAAAVPLLQQQTHAAAGVCEGSRLGLHAAAPSPWTPSLVVRISAVSDALCLCLSVLSVLVSCLLVSACQFSEIPQQVKRVK